MSRAFIQKIGYFTPLSVKGCALWLDALDTTTVTLSGSTVTQWRDKSPTGSTLTVPSGCGGPTYTTDTSSKQCLSFVGSTPTTLQTALVINLTTSFFYAVFTCGPYPNDTPHRYIAMSDTIGAADYQDAGGFALSYTNPTSPGYVEIQQNSVANVNNLNSPASGSVLIVSFGWSGTNFFVYKNGTSTYTNGPYTKGNSAWLVLGSVAASAGTLAPGNLQNGTYTLNEFVGYSSYPTQTQQQSIEGYLAQKWGLTANLPANHLGRSQTFYTAGKNPGIVAVPSFTMTNVPYTNYFPLSVAGCQLWLDGADTSTLLQASGASVTTTGQSVSTWKDKSGNGYNATANGTAATNGTNYVIFAGAQNYGTSLSSTMLTQSGFSVISYTGSAKMDIISVNSTSGTAGLQQIIITGSQIITSYGGATVVTGSAVSASTVLLYNYTFNSGVNAFIYLNGTQTGTSSGAAISGSGTISIGSYNNNGGLEPFTGNMYEILLYNQVLSTSQRQAVEGYLAWKWGTQSTLINTHPYYSAPPIEFNRPTQVAGLPLQLQIIPQPWTPLRPLSSGVLPWHWFKGDAGLTTTAWTNFGTSKSNASNVGTITLGNYTQGGTQAGGTNNTCTVSPSGYWRWTGVYQTSYHAIFGVFKVSSLTTGQTWTWKGDSTAGRGYTPQYRITNTSGVFTDDILSQGAFLPLNGVTIDPTTQFYTHSMVWGSTAAVSLLQVGTKIASPNGWTTDYGLGIYDNEYIGYAVAPAQPAGVTMTVCEILLFATNSGYGGPVDLTAQDILDVQSYLARKWGV